MTSVFGPDRHRFSSPLAGSPNPTLLFLLERPDPSDCRTWAECGAALPFL
jgi:hypothetical protein